MSATRPASSNRITTPLPAPFCLLAENRFAFTASQLLSVFDDDFAPSLVYLHGPSGVGKTHLARLFEQEYLAQHPDHLVRTISCHEFIQDLHEALSRSDAFSFRDNLTNSDAVIIEDIHTIERSPKAQEILTWGLDQFEIQQTRVLITSRKSPGDLQGILPRLRNRFRTGITAPLNNPSQSSRETLITHFADQLGFTMSADVVKSLSEIVEGSPREIDAVVKQVRRAAQSERTTLSEKFVRSLLLKDTEIFEPTISQIASCVATQFGVTVKAMRCRDRNKTIAHPRQTAIWLARRLTNLPLKRIGEYFSLSNHTTVMHAVKIVDQRRQETPAYDHELHRLMQKINGLPMKPR